MVRMLLGEGCRVEGMATIDEALFYKLRNNFPHVNPETIRLILAKHNNVEHEAIMAVLSTQSSRGARAPVTRVPSSPKIKLRYLKILFPDVDEDKLFDLLYNSDHDALTVITDLERMGYKKVDVIAAAKAKRELKAPMDGGRAGARPTSVRLSFPVAVAEKEMLVKKTQQRFPDVSLTLIEHALDCSGYDEEKAALFLSAMTPENSESYFKKAFEVKIPTTRELPCVATQTKALVAVVLDVPVTVPLEARAYECTDKGTWTKEDGVIPRKEKPVLAVGADPTLRTGPQSSRVM